MKKIVIATFICFFLLSIDGYAQTKQESIKTLFTVMKQDSLMDKTMNGLIPSMIVQMSSQYSTKDAAFNRRMRQATQLGMEASKKILKKMLADGEMVTIYDKHFSQEEINDFITFYKTPSGKKLLREMPSIAKDNMIVMQKYMPELLKEVKTKMDEVFAKEKP